MCEVVESAVKGEIVVRVLIFVKKAELATVLTKEFFPTLNVTHLESVGLIGSPDELDLSQIQICELVSNKLRVAGKEYIKSYCKRIYRCYYMEAELLAKG